MFHTSYGADPPLPGAEGIAAGGDAGDPGADDRSPISYTTETKEFLRAVRTPSVKGRRVAWTPDLHGLIPVDTEVAAVAQQGAHAFRSLGARVESSSPDFTGTNEIVLSTRGLMMAALHADKLAQWRDQMQKGLAWNAEINGKPLENYIQWVFLTYAISLTGLPAISVPCGFTRDGLPVGLQIVGRRRQGAAVLRAAAFERASPWTDRIPPVVNEAWTPNSEQRGRSRPSERTRGQANGRRRGA